jgi:hypothetical protein
MLELLFTLFVFKQSLLYPYEVQLKAVEKLTYNDCVILVHKIHNEYDPKYVYATCLPETKETEY